MPSREFFCSKCRDTVQGQRLAYVFVFDKCRGKTCPDCGKVRKLGRIRINHFFYDKPVEGESLMGCLKCGRSSEFFVNGVCVECFYGVQKEKGCVCPLVKKDPFFHYYCSLCEEFHSGNDFICKKCFEKENTFYNEQRKENFWIVVSFVCGIVIGFFLGWLLLVKLWKKKVER